MVEVLWFIVGVGFGMFVTARIFYRKALALIERDRVGSSHNQTETKEDDYAVS